MTTHEAEYDIGLASFLSTFFLSQGAFMINSYSLGYVSKKNSRLHPVSEGSFRSIFIVQTEGTFVFSRRDVCTVRVIVMDMDYSKIGKRCDVQT